MELSLIVPGSMSFVNVSLDFVKASALSFGFAEKDILHVTLAAEEAFTNVINGSLGNNAGLTYKVICRLLASRMEIVIKDKGMPFSPDDIPEYDPEDPCDVDGLSMYLLKKSIDEVQFRNLGRDGKEMILIKNITSKRIDNITKQDTLKKEDGCDDDLDWSMRLFEDKDALEVSRCAYETYGYTYEPYIYYPEQVVEMNRGGELLSVVAVDGDANLLAHVALKFDSSEKSIAEVGVAFVKPAYRKHGIFSKLFADILDKARSRNLDGVYGRAVTSHALSQRKMTDFGFVDCGAMLGLFPSDVEFKALTGKTAQKESAALSFLSLASSNHEIYPPARHQNMILAIFDSGSIPVTVAETAVSDVVCDGDDVELTYSRMEVFNTANIMCYKGYNNIIDDIHSAMKRLCVEHTDVLYLFLDLENPACAELAQQCESLGFFFAGVLPYGIRGHHALILQYLNNIEIDFSRIVLHSDFAKRILRYVENCENKSDEVSFSNR